ncbi:MAG: UDP-N-acetylmuramoyl-L-alanyl-D-glutamate--2,6-diaminopimelate ligase [Gammaproteobacteria bacterium RIFCSPHIGHO2_12_FULL_45_12]|nr:MAG: UDP-N-acetylmuramoyl-L-alanyl-D-glutamate--2,6-diaminopimelate ligase [Gammaproteobacteria bacterium RIFCSPHIGHO2_12_FULL_45_12]
MLLSRLLHAVFKLPVSADREISRLILDSRHIQPNDVFVAVKGSQQDGRHYIANAIAKGASAVLVQADAVTQTITMEQSVPIIPIAELPACMGELAARCYDYPAKHLYMIGVTGTNGKTSCTHFIAQLLQALGSPCGVIGTLGAGLFGQLGEAGLTTPDAFTVQAALGQMRHQGADAVAMEVSSHSIHQDRVKNIGFDVGVFTNLTQDHLDYHGNMAAYAAVKRRFLNELSVKQLVMNVDDAYGEKWLSELASIKPVYAYSLKPPIAESAIPLTYAETTQLSLQGIQAMVMSPWGRGVLTLPLIGQFNLGNALAALTVLCVKGHSFEQLLPQFANLSSVPGRMQVLGGEGAPRVVVDFAHTPDALEKVLKALRAHTDGKLICVFGCGGDRDTGKRPLMAKIAEQWADQVIVTNDNPRHESDAAIATQIMQGFTYPERVEVVLNRSHAIKNSIQCAGARDCVLIAGKGAEHFQQIGDEKRPFDDVAQVRLVLAAIVR